MSTIKVNRLENTATTDGGIDIDSSGDVGIGTSSPGANLHLSSSSDTIARITSADGSGAFLDLGDASDPDGGRIVYDSGSNLALYTASSERLRIDSSGRVGIGTSSPQSDLTVRGSTPQITLEPTADTQNCRLEFATTNGTVQSFLAGGGSEGAALKFLQSTTERARIDSSGKVGIGTSSPTNLLQVNSSIAGATIHVTNSTTGAASTDGLHINQDGNDTYIWNKENSFISFGTNNTERMRITSVGSVEVDSFTNLSAGYSLRTGFLPNATGGLGIMATDHSGANRDGCAVYGHDGISFYTAQTERMRISSGGSLFINRTSAVAAEKFSVGNAGQVAYFRCTVNANHSNIQMSHSYATGGQTATQISIQNASLTEVGSIKSTASSTSFNETSDYRLKENIVDIADGITRLKQLQPRRFNYIVDPDTTVDGFIAHEAQTVVPNAVHGTKDEVDDNGNAVLQGIDKSKLVPLLTAALQEAIAKIETLEARVTTLEAG